MGTTKPSMPMSIKKGMELRQDVEDKTQVVSAVMRADKQKIASLTLKISLLIDAWESLPGNGRYSKAELEDWLIEKMAPAIQTCREEIGRPRPVAKESHSWITLRQIEGYRQSSSYEWRHLGD